MMKRATLWTEADKDRKTRQEQSRQIQRERQGKTDNTGSRSRRPDTDGPVLVYARAHAGRGGGTVACNPAKPGGVSGAIHLPPPDEATTYCEAEQMIVVRLHVPTYYYNDNRQLRPPPRMNI